eukprot:tig00021127_g18685.t1
MGGEGPSGSGSGGTMTEEEYQRYRAELHLAHRESQLTTKQRIIRRLKDNPFVPLGALATAGVLATGLYYFRVGNQTMSQTMMRWRVGMQGFTLCAIAGGIVYDQYKYNNAVERARELATQRAAAEAAEGESK